jgi:ligand-binding sensor domain-containing protein
MAYGLDPAKAITQFGLDVWQRKQGLPQSSVNAIVQTRDGYLWLGTEEGLARFDGARFRVFDRKNTPELQVHNVATLLPGRDGGLWIGTLGGGLKRQFGESFTSITTENGLPEDIISALLEDPDGTLWLGTFSKGVTSLRNGRFTSLTTKEGLSSDEVRALYRDRRGDLWIGTRGGGVNRWSSGRMTVWTTREGLAHDQVTSLCGDAEGGVWVGTRGGLNRITADRVSTYKTKDGLTEDAIIGLHADRDGSIWIGTVGGGLNRFHSGRFTAMRKQQGLSNDSVRAFWEDSEGNLWVGTSGGLNRLRPGKLTTYSAAEGLSEDDVRPVLEDRAGNVWIGTLGGGLNRWSNGVITAFTTKDGLLSDRVWSLHEDLSGALWVGTREGLNRFRDGQWSSYTTKEGLAHNLVLAISQDSEGSLWIGTAGGLTRWKEGKFTVFGREEGLSNERVCVIAEGSDRTLWLGTMGGGLSRIVGGKAEAVPGPLSNAFVNAIYPDPDGTLWIGTGEGLWRFRDGRWTVFTTKEGLFDDVAYSILEDGRRNLWMSSNRGIFRVAKDDLIRFAEGSARTIPSMAFDASDGMKESECNGGFQPAGWKGRDGRLWFPTVKGVTVVDPEDAMATRVASPVFIEEVLADNERVPTDRAARFGPEKGRFEFHYTAVALSKPEKLRFRFRLEGFDREWVEAGTRRAAYYTNVPPGSYRFRVAAGEAGGPWSERGAAAFAFELTPHFYRTPWFVSLMGMAVLLSAALIHRARLRSARLESELTAARLQALRAQIQPHFLFNTLNMVLPLIYRDPDTASKTLVGLGDLLRSSLDKDATKLVPLRSELEFLHRYLEIQQVRFGSRLLAEFDIQEDVLDAAVPNLLLQPLVENAIKHGIAKRPGAGRVSIASRRDGDVLYVRVWNAADEAPLGPEEVSYGVGLSNLEERLEVLYGRRHRFTRRREPGGFEVVIRLPLTFLLEERAAPASGRKQATRPKPAPLNGISRAR